MFKYIGLSKRSHPLDHKRYRAIADKQRRLRAVDLAMLETADRATQRRLSVAQDAETAARLTQRCHDLAQIRTYFQTQTDVTFLGMYGWGAGCQVSAAPGQGISEYDAIVYEKNGRIVVEKIGSCWQLFRQQERFSGKVSSEVVTSGGDVFLLYPHSVEELRKKPSGAFFQDEKREMSPRVGNAAPGSGSSSAEVVYNPISELEMTGRQGILRARTHEPVHQKDIPKEDSKETQATQRKRLVAKPVALPVSGYCMSAEDFLKQPPKTFGCTSASCTDSNCKPRQNSKTGSKGRRPFHEKNTIPESENLIQESWSDILVVDTQEGCPCCLNAIDLDELAGLGKILNNTGDAASHVSFELATVDASWGLVAGLAGPFAMIGLVAAYRNVVGAYATRQVLRDKLAEVERLIAEASTPQLLAYRYCLQYSLFDTHWNIAVPGVLNGGSSTAVLSTLIVSSPLAIPALGAYATAQAGRGIYDMARFWNTMTGHDKIDQITRSKRLFYMSNTTAFTCMGVGAALVAVSPVTLGATLIPGLCLLIAGTVSSGVLNNIWPRKFRPRNGDLGVRRDTLNSQKCETLISKMREQKTIIKTFKKKHMHNSGALRVRKVLAKLTAVLPFCEKRAGNWLHALGQEQIAASMTQMTMHQSELFENLGIAIDAGVKVEDVVINGLKQLRYQQYGLVDFYWGLKRFEV